MVVNSVIAPFRRNVLRAVRLTVPFLSRRLTIRLFITFLTLVVLVSVEVVVKV